MKQNKLSYVVIIVTFVMSVLLPCSIAYSANEKTPKARAASKPQPINVQKINKVVQPVETNQNSPAKPKIEVLNPVFDLGKIGPGKKNNTLFKFKNVGNATLRIKKVQSTCSCSVPKLKKLVYEPGETGEVSVVFTSPKLPPKHNNGIIEKHLYILSNDPENPKAEIIVKSQVVLDVAISPASLTLSLQDSYTGLPITITSKDSKPFSIKSISSPGNTVTADFDPAVKKTKFVLTPKIDTEKLKKHLRGSITININHPTTSVVSVNYAAPPLFKISRPRFIIQNAEPGKTVTKDISIMSNYGQTVEIESITSKNNLLEVIEQTSGENFVKLMVKATPPALKGKTRYFTDKLEIKLKTGEILTVNCSGWYKRELLGKK